MKKSGCFQQSSSAQFGEQTSTNQAYKYTGKPFDDEGGFDLYYYEARYYDRAGQRFISVDPLAGKYPGWSPYVYTLGNPLKYVDPDGRETQIYSVPVGPTYKHLFIVVKNDKTFTSKGFYPQSRVAATINMLTGSNIASGNKVILKTDLPSELGEVKKLERGEASDASLEATIEPPDGMTESEYDQHVLQTVNKMSDNKVDYGVFGPNSNTMVDNAIETTGAKMPDIKGAKGQNYGEKPKKVLEPGHLLLPPALN